MFDIFSWQHIFILLVIALVVVGPKDLPRLMKMAGKWAGKARVVANKIRKSVDEVVRENELEELRDQISAMKKINPLSGLQNSLSDIGSTVAGPMATPPGSNVEASVAVKPQSSPEPRKDELKA
jgi:sec-independent protein translocase protein TatB